MLIDSHVNLTAPQFATDREAVIARAREAGIGLMLTICDRVSAFEPVRELADANNDIWCSVGTHPHEAKENLTLSVNDLTDRAHGRVVGIGETGLDYFYDHSPRDSQRAIFLIHIKAARATGLRMSSSRTETRCDDPLSSRWMP